jgi:hypothetical protein
MIDQYIYAAALKLYEKDQLLEEFILVLPLLL